MRLIKLENEYYLLTFDDDAKKGDMCLWQVQHEFILKKAEVDNALFHSVIKASTKQFDGIPLLDRKNIEERLNNFSIENGEYIQRQFDSLDSDIKKFDFIESKFSYYRSMDYQIDYLRIYNKDVVNIVNRDASHELNQIKKFEKYLCLDRSQWHIAVARDIESNECNPLVTNDYICVTKIKS
jgi:hypothetical protein